MQFIIMSDGKGTRWNNYLGITKQEAIINSERILDRTVRLLKENTDDKILILSSNHCHENPNAVRIKSQYNDYFHQKYAYDYLNEETTFLYGDTYYSQELINLIVNTEVNDIVFFGNEHAIVAVKVQDYELLKSVIDNVDPSSKSLYHAFDFLNNISSRFVNVGNSFVNINNRDDYDALVQKVKKLSFK